MRTRIFRLVALTVAAAAVSLGLVGVGGTSSANPGPGNSNQCAPGQQGNQDPGFRPASCDN